MSELSLYLISQNGKISNLVSLITVHYDSLNGGFRHLNLPEQFKDSISFFKNYMISNLDLFYTKNEFERDNFKYLGIRTYKIIQRKKINLN